MFVAGLLKPLQKLGMEVEPDRQPHNHPRKLCLVGLKKHASTHLSFVVSSCLFIFSVQIRLRYV